MKVCPLEGAECSEGAGDRQRLASVCEIREASHMGDILTLSTQIHKILATLASGFLKTKEKWVPVDQLRDLCLVERGYQRPSKSNILET